MIGGVYLLQDLADIVGPCNAVTATAAAEPLKLVRTVLILIVVRLFMLCKIIV